MMFKVNLLDDFPTAKGRGIVPFNLISLYQLLADRWG